MDDHWHPLDLNQFYCCPSLALTSLPYPALRAPLQPCFVVTLIDLRPTGDVAKDKGEAKNSTFNYCQGLDFQFLNRFEFFLQTY